MISQLQFDVHIWEQKIQLADTEVQVGYQPPCVHNVNSDNRGTEGFMSY